MGKGLREKDPKFSTHRALFAQLPRNADVLLLENVPEYDLKENVSLHLPEEWKAETAKIDPRHFGLGASRPRHYGLVWDTDAIRWDDRFTLEGILEALMAVPQMSSTDYWHLTREPSVLTSSEAWQTPLFATDPCKQFRPNRNAHIRIHPLLFEGRQLAGVRPPGEGVVCV